MSTGVLVLDSYALLAFVQDEAAADAVEAILHRSDAGELRLALSVVNLGEVYYRTVRAFDSDRAQAVLAQIAEYKIDIVDVDRDLALAAARIKGTYRLSYADCIAAALAQRLGGAVVTGDPEFRRIEHLVQIERLASGP